jgi:hypothetical protein
MQENKMRTFQRLCAAFVLTLMLALSAFAGEISTGIAATPPPSQQATAQGQIETGITGEISTGITATNPATDIALNLILSVLSLF